VRHRDGLSAELKALYQQAAEPGLTPEDRARLGSSLAAELERGFDPGAFLLAVSDEPLGATPAMQSAALGPRRARRLLYEAMLVKASEIQSFDAPKAQQLTRSAVLLSLLDFPARSQPDWVQRVRMLSAATPPALIIPEDSMEAWETLVGRIDSARQPAVDARLQFIDALGPVYDGAERIDTAKLKKSLRMGAELWEKASDIPSFRQTVAREVWFLKCLAASRQDQAGVEEIKRALNEWMGTAADPLSRKWIAEALTREGPPRRRPGIRSMTPDDLRPAQPG